MAPDEIPAVSDETGSAAVSEGEKAGATPAPPDEEAGSSPEAVSEETALDAARKALEPKPDEAHSAKDKPDDESAQKDEEDELDELSEEDQKNLPQRTARQIEKLLGDRREARTQLTEATRELETVRPRLQTLENLERFTSQAQLTNDDVAEGFQIMAMMRQDPAKALEVLEGKIAALRRVTGASLPQDLTDQVEQGFITEERARELSTLRARNQRHEQESQQRVRQEQERHEREQFQQNASSVVSVANEWGAQKAKSDAEYPRVQPFFMDALKAEIGTKGFPGSADAAKEMLGEVYKRTRANVVKNLPQKPVNPGVPETRSGRVSTEPKTAVEAAFRAVGKEPPRE